MRVNTGCDARGGRGGRDCRARRAGAVVLATVTGVAVPAAWGLGETAGVGTATSEPPFTPKTPRPSGRSLGPDAHVPSPTAVDDGDAPSDSARDAYRALFVDGTAYGRDGWTGTGPQATVYVKPVRSGKGEPWRVDEVRTVEAAVSAPTPSGQDSAAASKTPASPAPSPSARPE